MNSIFTKERVIQLMWATLGSLMFAIATNVLIMPLGLYNGGFMGITQLIHTFLIEFFNLRTINGIDIFGILYFVINVPLFYLGYRVMKLEFLIKTVLTVGIQSVLLTVVPILEEPIIEDYLTACIIAGIIAGAGVGIVLRAGCSGGGQDIIGVVCAKIYPSFSVGKISISMNIAIYAVCLWLYDIQIVIYSLIYTTVLAMALDKFHTQNICTTAMIFTKTPGVPEAIIKELGRGVTRWDGAGGYTNETSDIMLTVISKYEVGQLKKTVLDIDPRAFIIFTEGNSVTGNFEKRL